MPRSGLPAPGDDAHTGRTHRTVHPKLVLLSAIVLPGSGQVINAQPMRGLTMLFFMLLFAMICHHLTTPEHSLLGRYAGGWFVYAISVMDAYQWAHRRRGRARASSGGNGPTADA